MALLGRLRWPIALLAIGIGVLTPLFISVSSGSTDVSDPVIFSEYRADFVVAADGALDATETITAEFPLWRHGLFRYWDVANPNDPHIRQPPDITEITLDGEAGAVRPFLAGRSQVPGRQDRRSRPLPR